MATTLQAPKPITRKAVPDQNPYTTVIMICPTCAQIVLPTLSRMANGTITDIIFYHVNEEYGCAWKNIDSKARAMGPTEGLKTDVRHGNDGKGHSVFIDEHDLAVGKSFDLDGLKPQVPSPIAGAGKTVEILKDLDAANETPKGGTLKFHPPAVVNAQAPAVQGAETAESKSETGYEGEGDGS